jgi:hypothetical protein
MCASAIDFAAMADLQNENSGSSALGLGKLNFTDGAEIANAITPQSSERTCEGFSEGARVVLFGDPIVQKI